MCWTWQGDRNRGNSMLMTFNILLCQVFSIFIATISQHTLLEFIESICLHHLWYNIFYSIRYAVIFIFQLQWLAFKTIIAYQPSIARVGLVVHFNIWPEGCHFSISTFDIKKGTDFTPRNHSDLIVMANDCLKWRFKALVW